MNNNDLVDLKKKLRLHQEKTIFMPSVVAQGTDILFPADGKPMSITLNNDTGSVLCYPQWKNEKPLRIKMKRAILSSGRIALSVFGG